MKFKVGGGRIIQDFEHTVIRLEPGESTSIGIPANKAYGPYKDELTQQIPKSSLPEDLNPEIDQRLEPIQENIQLSQNRYSFISISGRMIFLIFRSNTMIITYNRWKN